MMMKEMVATTQGMTIDPMAVSESILHPESIEKFKLAVAGEIPYNSLDVDIAVWEDFLANWLEGEYYENAMEYMKLLYHTFRETFRYDGTLWRGFEVLDGIEVKGKELACYSSDEEIGRLFAGKSELYGVTDDFGQKRCLIEIEVSGAFALDELMERLCYLTMNGRLLDQIDEKMYECEKIFPQPEYLVEMYR